MRIRIGIDLGGTKIEAVAMGPDGEIFTKERIATPPDYAACLDAIAALTARLAASAGADDRWTLGVGMPGSPSPRTGLIRNANSTWLNGRPFVHDLGTRLGRPIRAANDANCFALSEATDGAGAGAAVVFGVILGTGCGGGLIVNGALIEGASGVAGEWGHTPLPWAAPHETPGPDCWCGKQGCMETWVSGPAFERHASSHLGARIKAAAIAERAQAGDAAAHAALSDLASRLARGLAGVINTVDPDVIVLGGGLSNIEPLPAMIEARLADFVFSDHVATRVLKNAHGDSSGVRGAAWLWRVDEP